MFRNCPSLKAGISSAATNEVSSTRQDRGLSLPENWLAQEVIVAGKSLNLGPIYRDPIMFAQDLCHGRIE